MKLRRLSVSATQYRHKEKEEKYSINELAIRILDLEVELHETRKKLLHQENIKNLNEKLEKEIHHYEKQIDKCDEHINKVHDDYMQMYRDYRFFFECLSSLPDNVQSAYWKEHLKRKNTKNNKL